MTSDQHIDIGAEMWLSIATEFTLAMEVEGITDIADKALVFAGFINTLAGHMLGTLGPEVSRQILDQAKDNCAKCVRSQMRVVPK